MKTLLTGSNFSCDSNFDHAWEKWPLAEPVFAIAAGLFWLIALPFGAAVLALVKVWDTCVALVSGHAIRPNPLILRFGPGRPSQADTAAHAARA